MLFTFPSRYSSSIGLPLYLALPDGPGCFLLDSSCLAVLRLTHQYIQYFVYGAFTLCGLTFQLVPLYILYLIPSGTSVAYYPIYA